MVWESRSVSLKVGNRSLFAKAHQTQNNSQHASVDSSARVSHAPITSLSPTHAILWSVCVRVCVPLSFFKKSSSISLHPPSSHPPQVVCGAQSSTVWINDWCSRLQVKVTEVHYWIIFALLSLLPSAWPLLVDVVGALQGTLSANALKTWMRVHVVCLIPPPTPIFFFF